MHTRKKGRFIKAY